MPRSHAHLARSADRFRVFMSHLSGRVPGLPLQRLADHAESSLINCTASARCDPELPSVLARVGGGDSASSSTLFLTLLVYDDAATRDVLRGGRIDVIRSAEPIV